MDQAKRTRLHEHTLNFIKSPQFLTHLNVLRGGETGEVELRNLQSTYIRSMKGAKVEMAYLWMANSMLLRGRIPAAPGLLISGGDGTEQSEGFVQRICEKLSTNDYSRVDSSKVRSVKKTIKKQLSDQNFNFGRARLLPLEFTSDYPVYLFDTQLTAESVDVENFGPMVPCLVNVDPNAEVKIFAIPLTLLLTVDSVSPVSPVESPYLKQSSLTTASFSPSQTPPMQESGLAKKAKFLGIFGFCTGFLFFGYILALIGVILGFFALFDIKRSKGAKYGEGSAILGIFMGTISLIFLAGFIALGLADRDKPAEPKSPLEIAESSISSGSSNKYAYGNSKEAIEIAEEFSDKMKGFRNQFYERPSALDDALSLIDGEFITYCQLNNDSCAFLVQVPELRNYTAEAKSALADQSWFVANSVLISHDYEPGFKLGVGTRGKVIYQRIDIGEVSANATLKLTDGVKSSVGGLGKYTEQFLGQFFEE